MIEKILKKIFGLIQILVVQIHAKYTVYTHSSGNYLTDQLQVNILMTRVTCQRCLYRCYN